MAQYFPSTATWNPVRSICTATLMDTLNMSGHLGSMYFSCRGDEFKGRGLQDKTYGGVAGVGITNGDGDESLVRAWQCPCAAKNINHYIAPRILNINAISSRDSSLHTHSAIGLPTAEYRPSQDDAISQSSLPI